MITQERLKELLTYSPERGFFYWNNSRHGVNKYQTAGYYDSTSRNHRIRLDNKTYVSARLAWLYVYGASPEKIRFIDGNRANIAISNLVAMTTSNIRHSSEPVIIHNKHKYRGISYYPSMKDNKWASKITLNRKCILLGFYLTDYEAHLAYQKARQEILDGTFVMPQQKQSAACSGN